MRPVAWLTLLAAFVVQAGVAEAQESPPRGYARSDDVNAVVYREPNGHIYELWLAPGGEWSLGDLTALTHAPSATTNPTAYVRYNFGCCAPPNSVVYVTASGNIIDLSYEPEVGVWQRDNLTALTGAPPAVVSGQPTTITRWDTGSNPVWSVTFKSQSNGHLYEIVRNPQASDVWSAVDLTALSGAPAAAGLPNAVSLWLGYQNVFYRHATGHVIHVSKKQTEASWVVQDLTAATNGPLTTTDGMTGLRRPDGYASIAYRGTDGQIYEFYRLFNNPSWSVGGPGNLAGAPAASSAPASYVRADDTYSILYNTSSGHIIELHLNGTNWHYHDLTALANAPVSASGKPSPFVRADDVNSVVYRGTNGHIYELYSFSGNTWHWGDLTLLAQ